MEGKVTPKRLPLPRTMLGFDGTDFVALKTDADGRLIVRGEDQLFNIEEVVAEYTSGAISGAEGFFASAPVPAGRYWVITNVRMADETTATTVHTLSIRHAGTDTYFGQNTAAFGANVASVWGGHIYLAATDVIRVWFAGGLVADTCHVWITGYQMDIEA